MFKRDFQFKKQLKKHIIFFVERGGTRADFAKEEYI